MNVTLISRYPRVDTLPWKQRVGEALLAAGMRVSVLYSRASLPDQALAGIREEGIGVLRRYLDLRRSGTGAPPTRSLASWAEQRELEVTRTSRLSDPAPLAALAPDVAVLLGADIVPPDLLSVPRLGTINAHYGLLPAYRGMNVTEWSVLRGDPIGVTVHLVEPGIDTGPILVQQRIELEPGETFESLRRKHQALAAELLVAATKALVDGTARPVRQARDAGRQYYRMHPALRRVAERRLRDQARAVAPDRRGAGSSRPASAAAASASPSATWASHQRR
jgi:methionyl-tRNA formyltransferase